MSPTDCEALAACLLARLAPVLSPPVLSPPVLNPAGLAADEALARRAAEQALAAYRPRHGGELLPIAQIVGFAVSALDNLRLAAAPAASVNRVLRLRGNAASLSRIAQRAAAGLEQQRRSVPEPADAPGLVADPGPQAPVQPAPAHPEPSPAPEAMPTADPRTAGQPNPGFENPWAAAMTAVAAELTAALPGLPPSERRAQRIRIDALQQTARSLGQTNRAQLLSTTTLGNPPESSMLAAIHCESGALAPDNKPPHRG